MRLFLILLFAVVTGCETEAEISEKGQPAKLFYTPNCATISGYLIPEGMDKHYVFQHDLEENFQGIGLEVFVTYEFVEEAVILTAECAQGEVIRITSIRLR